MTTVWCGGSYAYVFLDIRHFHLMVDVMRKAVHCRFDEAVRRVEEACTSEGFVVLLKKDMDKVFRQKLGIDNYPRFTMILACSPRLAKMALDVSKDIGTLFPCSFVVYEEEQNVFVAHTSIMKTAVEIGIASRDRMEPVLAETSRGIQAIWERI
ncbi:MAG: DUF302 domain-containing protein [Candidatus Thorarchaeota archaeon]